MHGSPFYTFDFSFSEAVIEFYEHFAQHDEDEDDDETFSDEAFARMSVLVKQLRGRSYHFLSHWLMQHGSFYNLEVEFPNSDAVKLLNEGLASPDDVESFELLIRDLFEPILVKKP